MHTYSPHTTKHSHDASEYLWAIHSGSKEHLSSKVIYLQLVNSMYHLPVSVRKTGVHVWRRRSYFVVLPPSVFVQQSYFSSNVTFAG